MVIPPPAGRPAITKFLKPYILKIHFTNCYVSAQVVHTPSATITCAASSQEKILRASMGSTSDVAAAAKIGKLLGERLLFRGIPAVYVSMSGNQMYPGKFKAVIDSLRDTGVKLV